MRFRSTCLARFVMLSLMAISLLTGPVFSQETRGTILGTVKDSTGGVVPGVEVTVTNTNTNVTQKIITNDSGFYEVPYLLPGMYSVSAQLSGFKRYVRHGIDLATNARTNVDIVLETGEVTEEVSVTAAPSRGKRQEGRCKYGD